MSITPVNNKYELSPLQQGLLFNTLYAPHSGVDIIQVVCTLHEHIRSEEFEQAWQAVFEKYAVLRTAFTGDGLTEFQQEITSSCVLPFKQQDWSTTLPEKRQSRLEDFLRTDRQMGFNLAEPPLIRLNLCCISDSHYYFIFTFHHIILDGRSLLMLFNDVFLLYDAFFEEKEVSSATEVPYRDYLAWLRYRDTTGEKEFWQQWLRGVASPTTINNSRIPKNESDSFKNFEEQNIRFTYPMTTALKKLAQQNQLTLNTILQGAWAMLLSRYIRQDDVVFGVTRSCRRETVEGSEKIVGLLINTLPMRVRISPDAILLKWLKDIRYENDLLQKHVHSDLMQVHSWSEIPKETPLFDHIVIFENFSLHSALRSQGGRWHNREFELRRKPNYPLTVYGFDESELLIKIIYDPEIFDETTIKRMLLHLQTLIEGMLANPSCQLKDLWMLPMEERQQLLAEWNAVQLKNLHNQCIHELFEEQALRAPGANAVTFEEHRLTYNDLNLLANRLAHHLQQLGVGPNVLVGVCMEPSLEMVIGLLSILKAGGAYVPLNPSYPKDRLAFILEDTKAAIIITQTQCVNKLPQCSAHIISLDPDLSAVQSEQYENLPKTAALHNLAYVIYTSGSTGQPKGVQVTHQNVISLFSATQAWFQFNEDDIWTLFHSFAFDFSVWEIWGALLHGGQLVIVPFWVSRSPDAFYNLLRQRKVTILNQTPSAFYQLIQVDNTADSGQKLNLRWIILGGEKLEVRNLKPWFLRNGDRIPQLVNMYGITETTVHVTFRPLTLKDLDNPSVSVIGRPIPGWQVYLLDQYQQPVPTGIQGEMYIGGAGVSSGYLNRPELTAERFISNPFDKLLGKYLYRSGDLARYLPNGEFEYLGRIDEQIKIRGFRIELGEIETILQQHSAVQNCVVVLREVADGDKHLVAYVVPNAKTVSPNELREFLKAKLPDYMLPTAFIFMENLPLTPNGKLDHRALPTPKWVARKDTAFIKPRNPTEEILAAIWADVLHLNEVGVQENFFEMGGHSLIAAQLMSRVRKAFKIELSLRVLFDSPTIEGLAQAITELLNANSQPFSSIDPISRTAERLLTTVNTLSDEEVEDMLSEFFEDESDE